MNPLFQGAACQYLPKSSPVTRSSRPRCRPRKPGIRGRGRERGRFDYGSAALRFFCACLLSLATVLLNGCATPRNASAQPEPAGATPAADTTPVSVAAPNTQADTTTNSPGADWVSPGNKVTITFSGIPNPPPKYEDKVREDGYINPPLLGPVMAAGKTIGKLQEELQSLYVPKYYTRALTVTVSTDERWFFVGGEVRSSSRYIYSGQMTVLKAIQTAGGFTEYARRSKVQVTRADGRKEKPVNCDKAVKNPKLDLPIYPGDQIIVNRRLL